MFVEAVTNRLYKPLQIFKGINLKRVYPVLINQIGLNILQSLSTDSKSLLAFKTVIKMESPILDGKLGWAKHV